jgi:hypothetical protein
MAMAKEAVEIGIAVPVQQERDVRRIHLAIVTVVPGDVLALEIIAAVAGSLASGLPSQPAMPASMNNATPGRCILSSP